MRLFIHLLSTVFLFSDFILLLVRGIRNISTIVEIQSDKRHRKCMTTNNLDNRVRVYNMIHDSQPIASVKNKSHKIKCISNVGGSQTSIFGAIISNTWRGMVCAQCMFSFFAYVSREILSKFYIYVQYMDRYFDG